MLQRILLEIDKDSEVVFYYAGHGVQIGGANYLIPVDAAFKDVYDLPFEAVSLTTIVNVLGARARTQIVILDSCRSNPFAGALVLADITGTPSAPQDGFNVLTAPVNSLLAFSTSPGANAYDGTGPNSPFTAALVEEARGTPEEAVGTLLEEVRRQVYARTEGRQVPWESSTLVQSVSFGLPAAGLLLADGERRPALVAEPADAAGDDARPGRPARRRRADRADRAPRPGDRRRLDPRRRPRPAARDTGQHLRAARERPAPRRPRRRPPRRRRPPDRPDRRRPRHPRLRARDGRRARGGRQLHRRRRRRSPRRSRSPSSSTPATSRPPTISTPRASAPAATRTRSTPRPRSPPASRRWSAAPDVGRFQYQLGRVQLALRDFDAAEASFERARDLGHTRAWVALGLIVANADAQSRGLGDDAPAPPEALALFQEGVDAGDPYALHTLGRELLRHGPDEATRRRGFELEQQAVEFGHTFAMNELGAYYMNPASPDADPERGLTYIRESAARNDIYGYYNLGLVYRDGLAGVAPDLGAAVEWFEKAAASGHPAAPGTLGRLWNSGALGEADRDTKAIEWYDEGLARCDGWSGANAAWIIANRAPPGYLPRDAAVRAAKAAVLSGEDSAAEARSLLATLDAAGDRRRRPEPGATPSAATIEVDGAFGPGERDRDAARPRPRRRRRGAGDARPTASSPSPAPSGRASPAASTSIEPRARISC